MIVSNFIAKPAIKIGNSPPQDKLILWFDVTVGAMKYYNPNTDNWELVQDIALIERIARKEARLNSLALGGD